MSTAEHSLPVALPLPGPLLHGRRIGLLTAWASRANAGVFEALAMQAAMIGASGGEALVFALKDEYGEEDRARLAPSTVELHTIVGPKLIGYAPGLTASLLAADLDCVHLHGIWMYPSRAGAIWAQRTGRPYLISPYGMLEPWITSRGRWKKVLARIGYERASWRAARAFHALTLSEARDIAAESGRHESIVLPNSGPPVAPPDPAPRGLNIVFLGRIHPKKNVLGLVAGWQRATLPPGSRLTIAGWGALQDIADLRGAIGDDRSIDFVGPAFGEAKQALLAGARFTILPSHSEGLPISVLESWAAGAPAIITEACNFPEGYAANAALACGTDVASIAAALTLALSLDEQQWREMAGAARALASGPFSAESVTVRWAEAYAALLSPAWVHAPA